MILDKKAPKIYYSCCDVSSFVNQIPSMCCWVFVSMMSPSCWYLRLNVVRVGPNPAELCRFFPSNPPQGHRSPSVTDVLLLDAAVVSPTEGELGPPGRLNFNKSGHNSFHTCGVKQGEVCVCGGVLSRPQPSADIICSGFGECEPAA